MGMTGQKKESTSPIVMNAKGSFKGYGPGERKHVGEADVAMSPALRKILELWMSFPYLNDEWQDPFEEYYYEEGFAIGYHAAIYNMLEFMAKEIGHGAKDVEEFSLMLADFQNENNFSKKAGLFLSALINSGTDSEYTIFLDHLEELIDELGFRNQKKILVMGNVGDGLGLLMGSMGIIDEGGKIHVKGDVGDDAGFLMEGGEITVDGNASRGVGAEMMGGKITIIGEAEGDIGWGARGGEIHLEGEYGAISKEFDKKFIESSRKIYHKGKLIFQGWVEV